MVWLHLMCKWTVTIQIREKAQYIVSQRGAQLLRLSWTYVPVLAVPPLCGVPLLGRPASSSPAADCAAVGVHSRDAPWSSARETAHREHVCFTVVWEEAPLVKLSSTVLYSDLTT